MVFTYLDKPDRAAARLEYEVPIGVRMQVVIISSSQRINWLLLLVNSEVVHRTEQGVRLSHPIVGATNSS